MKYFLTGATGFVGGRIAELLCEAGHEVVALVRDPARAGKLSALGVQLAPGDVTDKESMRAPMQGCDGVFHVAGWYKMGRDPKEGQRINVDGTRNVLELMRELRIPKGVYTSTLAIFSDTQGRLPDETYRHRGPFLNHYERTKAEAHEIADAFMAEGPPLVVLMPGLIYGPGGNSISDESWRMYLRGQLPLIPKKSAFAWAHIDDVAAIHLTAMEKARPGSTYIVAGPPHTLPEAMEIAHQATGKGRPLAVPGFVLTLSAWLVRPLEWLFTLPEAYTSESLRTQAGVTYLGDNRKAREELGYAPRPLAVGFPELLRHELEQMR